MIFSENWLRDLVEVPVDRGQLAERLTMAGLEVEEVKVMGADLEQLVVAQILSVAPHPESSRLQVCQVEHGDGAPLQVVCGAANVRVGLKAPFARVGAALPGGLRIETAELRGVESIGMLCSSVELGLVCGGTGLFELPDDAPLGESLVDYLGLPDAMIELGLTPNRADCLGMFGLARETAALFGTQTCLPQVDVVVAGHDDALQVRVDASDDCPIYSGRLIRGLTTDAPSPLWLTQRLLRSGLRPQGIVVDVTNYVMLETGQPLHAFDAARIAGDIHVRRAAAGEKVVLLDDSKVELDGRYLVIADANSILALAGIMGGKASSVQADTCDIFLESAHFAPSAISGLARELGLHTDASHRFERGVDTALPALALERATALLMQLAGGNAGPATIVRNEVALARPEEIILRSKRLRRILGIDVPPARVVAILGALGMPAREVDGGWSVAVPSWRFDIAIEEDLIEEVARIHGYDKIPANPPAGELAIAPMAEDRVADALLRNQLAGRDYHEAISYAFVSQRLLEDWGMAEGAIALSNPLSADLAMMRTSVLPGLVAALRANRHRQQPRVRLFEMGHTFHEEGGDGPREVSRIAAAALGTAAIPQWGEQPRDIDFFDMKGDVESLLALTGAAAPSFSFIAEGPPWLHPGRRAALKRDGATVGHVGALDPRLLARLDIEEDIYVFELEIDPLAAREVPLAAPLSRFPSLRRDLAIVVPDDVSFAQLRSTIRDAVGVLLVDCFVFDRYTGTGLEPDTVSLAIGLILQDFSRTLTDADADHAVAAALARLGSECNAKLRG